MAYDDLDLLAEIHDLSPEQDRIAAALADLRDTEQRCRSDHYSDCLCGTLAERIRRTLSEDR